MAEEKISAEEVLDEEQLDGIAGGNYEKIVDDYKRIRKIVGFPKDLNKALLTIGNSLGVNLRVSGESKYYVDNKVVPRKEFWSLINEGISTNKIKFERD